MRLDSFLLRQAFKACLKIALIISVIGVLLFGAYPNVFLDLANQAAVVFLY